MVSSSLTSRYAVSCMKPVAKPGAIQINYRSFIRFEWSGAICPSTPRFPPRQRRRMVDVVLSEILAVPAERSRGRHNPRAVKRKMSNFPTKSRAVPNPLPSQRIHYEDHIRVVAPVVLPDPAQIWQQQIQSWQASGLRRTEYCECHGLPPCTFNKWIAKLRPAHRQNVQNAAHSL